MRHTSLVAVVGLVALLAVGGCGDAAAVRSKTVPVTGTVTRGGKPVANAQVNFITAGAARNGAGQTDALGKFVLGTFGNSDGAVVGDHVVTVKKVSAVDTAAVNMPPKPEDLAKSAGAGQMTGGKADESIPAKYADPKTTTLKATVKGDGQDNFAFDLID